ncbi:MAG: hypothetical protein IJH04_03340 [Eggerthellaceae bacterium]|nr:hypothetical protein [Eggerthellaceae bacterium]
MSITYDANIPGASQRLYVMKDIRPTRRLKLKVKGFIDRKGGAILQTDDGCCGSQFSMRRLRKLGADIEALRRQLHRDTYEGRRRLAEIQRECENLDEKIKDLETRCMELETLALKRPYEGDRGTPASVVTKRNGKRKAKASAAVRNELNALRKRRDELLVEKEEIGEVHRQRMQIAVDSRNQLCATFLIEMHIYLDAAKRPGLEPPDISEESAAEMAVA